MAIYSIRDLGRREILIMSDKSGGSDMADARSSGHDRKIRPKCAYRSLITSRISV
jgi:hypothetical protein